MSTDKPDTSELEVELDRLSAANNIHCKYSPSMCLQSHFMN